MLQKEKKKKTATKSRVSSLLTPFQWWRPLASAVQRMYNPVLNNSTRLLVWASHVGFLRLSLFWGIIKCQKQWTPIWQHYVFINWNLAGIQKLPLFFNIFIRFEGILYSARGVLITQRHLGILQLPRPWSYLISRLWSRFPLVISNQNLSGYCLLEEAKPPVSFLCDYAIITGIVAVWNGIHVYHAFDIKYFQSHVFQIHQLIVSNRDLESAKLTYFDPKLKIIPNRWEV